MTIKTKSKLSSLKKGKKGKIISLAPHPLTGRLMEMGLFEGAAFEVMHESPFGKQALAVRVRGALVALRRQEADHIEIELD